MEAAKSCETLSLYQYIGVTFQKTENVFFFRVSLQFRVFLLLYIHSVITCFSPSFLLSFPLCAYPFIGVFSYNKTNEVH